LYGIIDFNDNMATAVHPVYIRRKPVSNSKISLYASLVLRRSSAKQNDCSVDSGNMKQLRSISMKQRAISNLKKSQFSIISGSMNSIKCKIKMIIDNKAARVNTALPQRKLLRFNKRKSTDASSAIKNDLEINGMNISSSNMNCKSSKCIHSKHVSINRDKENFIDKSYTKSTSKISKALHHKNIIIYKNGYPHNKIMPVIDPHNTLNQAEKMEVKMPCKVEVEKITLFERRLLNEYQSLRPFKNDVPTIDSPVRMESLLKDENNTKKSEEISCCLSPTNEIAYYGI
jgi:hypothetical protein